MFLLGFATLFSQTAGAQDLPLADRQADFKTFVKDFEDSYAWIDRPDKPWLSWPVRYAPAVEQARSREQFADVLASALAELHDFHAEVRARVVHDWLPVPTFADLWADLPAGGEARLLAVRRGSDAERAGIQAGDLVLRVDTQPLVDALSARLGAPLGEQTPAAQHWALLSVLTGEWKVDRTLTLRRPSGQIYTVVLPGIRRFDRSPDPLTATLLPGNIGLIRFNNSLGEQKTVAALDAALLQFQHTAGLLLDLRDVPSGGDSSVALGILGRFVTQPTAYQRHRIPHYGQPDVERNWVEFVAPRGPFPYQAPVVILVNHWTGSMGEGIAIGFDAMHRATVVGTPMAHLAGAVTDNKLPRTGIDVAYATEQIFHVNGTPRQQWLPPVLIQEPMASGGAEDPLLQRGLRELTRPLPSPMPAWSSPVLQLHPLSADLQ